MIQSGPQIDARPRIQAGGLIHLYREAGGFYPKFYGITTTTATAIIIIIYIGLKPASQSV